MHRTSAHDISTQSAQPRSHITTFAPSRAPLFIDDVTTRGTRPCAVLTNPAPDWQPPDLAAKGGLEKGVPLEKGRANMSNALRTSAAAHIVTTGAPHSRDYKRAADRARSPAPHVVTSTDELVHILPPVLSAVAPCPLTTHPIAMITSTPQHSHTARTQRTHAATPNAPSRSMERRGAEQADSGARLTPYHAERSGMLDVHSGKMTGPVTGSRSNVRTRKQK